MVFRFYKKLVKLETQSNKDFPSSKGLILKIPIFENFQLLQKFPLQLRQYQRLFRDLQNYFGFETLTIKLIFF